MKFSVNPPEQFALPSHQRLFQLVPLDDFISCEQFLEMVACRLGVAVPSVNNANAIKTVRGLIRSRYMAHSRFLKATFDQGPMNILVAACWKYAATATHT